MNFSLLLMILLYGGALLLSRTEGFARLVCEQLETRTGMKFEAKRAALTPSLGMVMRDVKGQVPDHPLKAGLSAERVYLRWKWIPLLLGSDSPLKEMRAENVTLRFAVDPAGRWQPESFGAVSDWLARRLSIDLSRYTNLVALAGLASNAPPSPGGGELDLFAEDRIEMVNGTVRWQVVADSEIGRAEGIHLTSTRIALPERFVTHFAVHFLSAATAQGLRYQNKRMELFDMEGRELWIEGWPTNSPPPHLPQPPVLIRRPQPLRKPEPPATNPPAGTVATPTNPVPARPAGNAFPGPEE